MSWWQYKVAREPMASYWMAGVTFVNAIGSAIPTWLNPERPGGALWWVMAAMSLAASVLFVVNGLRHPRAKA